jgi:CCR4-NOT transcriptional regulation complex NOT5 subunit
MRSRDGCLRRLRTRCRYAIEGSPPIRQIRHLSSRYKLRAHRHTASTRASTRVCPIQYTHTHTPIQKTRKIARHSPRVISPSQAISDTKVQDSYQATLVLYQRTALQVDNLTLGQSATSAKDSNRPQCVCGKQRILALINYEHTQATPSDRSITFYDRR